MTVDELVIEMQECVDKDFYFEIGSDDTRALLNYIQHLQGAADDDRGVL